MRAFIIDPFKREVREIDDNFKDFRTIKAYVAQGEPGPLSVTFSGGPRFSSDIHSWVDDEGAYRPEQAWFRLQRYPHAIAGYCLVTGIDFDDEGPVPGWLSVEMIRDLVSWVSAENAQADFPPINISTLGDRPGEPGKLVSSTPVDFSDLRPIRGKEYKEFGK